MCAGKCQVLRFLGKLEATFQRFGCANGRSARVRSPVAELGPFC